MENWIKRWVWIREEEAGEEAQQLNSLDAEAMEIAAAHCHHSKDVSIWHTLALAFQTLGVVYGDMGTSPLYVFTDVFSKPMIMEKEVHCSVLAD
ncbi:hypothetical protein ACOSP7_018289 [Xanthoceras sorbifolium]